MSRFIRALAYAAGLLMCASPAIAEPAAGASAPCGAGALASGPLSISLFEGEIAVPMRACPRTELRAGPSGSALIDTPAFFGTLDAALSLGGSYRYGEAGEAFASAEIPRFRFVQNATITGSQIGLGWVSAGASHRVVSAPGLRVAAAGRLSLAGPGLYESSFPGFAELGAAAQWAAAPSVSVHGYAGAIAGAALGRGPAGSRVGLQARAGAAYRLGRLALAVDAGAVAGYDAPFDSFDLTPGARVHIWRDLAAELALSIPLAGDTRTDVAGAASVSWRL